MKKRENKIKGLTVFAVLIAALMISFILSGCDQQAREAVQLVLKDIAQQRSDSIDGFLGTVEIFTDEPDGRRLTPIGETATRRITIENSGTGDLIINDIAVYLQVYDSAADEMTGEYFQDIFKIVEETKPDLPLVIPPGGSFTSLYVSFSPVESGETTGVLALETNAGENFFRIWGNGAWRLDLEVTGTTEYGKIVEPIVVEAGEGQKTYYATHNEVTLKAETLHLQNLWELDEWIIASGDAVIEDNPDTPDPEWKLLTAVVTLSGHAKVEAYFISPYVYVDASEPGGGDGSSANPVNNIADGINIYNVNTAFAYDLKGICVAAGTYPISADETVTRDVIFRGGFYNGFNDRAYKTAGDRSTYQTLINTTDVSLGFSSAVMDSSVLEGFTLQGSTGTAVIPVFANGSDVNIRYNTITAPVGGYGIGLEKSDSTIENNTIYGANGGLRSVGIYVNDYSDPTITGNTITAGNPTSDGGESIAIYVDWFSNPVIDDNILTAGQATGDRGKSAGVYSVNSSSPVIKNNIISAGYGKSVSYALYFSYGGWPVIDNNTMFTPPDGSQNKYGLYVGASARIDSMTRNNLYGFPQGYAYIYTEGRVLTTIQELNDRWVPEDSGFEEPDNYSEEP